VNLHQQEYPNLTEPHDKAKRRIMHLGHTILTREGTRFLEEYERRGEAVLGGRATDFERMANQAWFAERFRLLPPHDRQIIAEVMRFEVTGASSVKETIEEMTEEAHQNTDRGSDLVAYAQQLQAYAGEPLREDMEVREAGEALKQLLFESDV
jgi:hypothetical protein